MEYYYCNCYILFDDSRSKLLHCNGCLRLAIPQKEQEKKRVTHMRLLKDLSGIQLEVKMARSEKVAVNVPTYFSYSNARASPIVLNMRFIFDHQTI